MTVAAAFDPSSLGRTENWDDDFEFQHTSDKTEQPPQRRQGHPPPLPGTDIRKMSIASSTAFEDWDVEEGQSSNISRPSSSTSQAILQQHSEQHADNWDDDFEDARNSPRNAIRMTAHRKGEEIWDDQSDLENETEDNGADFGFADREEDHTVTAKSRRAALQRLSSSSAAPSLPPPMPPPLPTTLSHGPYQSFSRPFPQRSPNSSVFSVPTTAQTHQTHDYSSTTHLRPSSAFALLPPSPPLHKERERRRLRKKSRPKPQGTFELASLRGSSTNASETRLGAAGLSQWYRNRHSFSDDGDAEHSACEPAAPFSATARLRTGTPTDNSSVDDRRAITPSLSIPAVPQTPVKGALLSRIGSVKKWGVRRKRASTTPSEVVADPHRIDADLERTPRVQSSRTSFHANIHSTRDLISSDPPTHAPQLPASIPQQPNVVPSSSTGSTWFFRASSAGSPNPRFASRSGSGASSKGDRDKQAEKSMMRGRSGSVNQNRSRSGAREGQSLNSSRTDLHQTQVSAPSTPSKLLKRKSLGFVQLRKATGAAEDREESHVGSDGLGTTESPRKGKYIGIGLGHAAGRREVDGVDSKATEHEDDGQAQEESRSRRKSFSKFLLDRDKGDDSNGSSQGVLDKERDGSRGFMGSVRRISLVGAGKHKRTKSGSGALLSISERNKVPPLPSSTRLPTTKLRVKPSANVPYSLPPLPITSSQLSLRLPTPSSLSFQQNSRHSSMHDLPTVFCTADTPVRIASTSSAQSQISTASSIVPSSSSNHSSRNANSPIADLQKTPVKPRGGSRTRSRTSEEGPLRRRKSTSSRNHSSDVTAQTNTDFFQKLLQPTTTENHEANVLPLMPQTPSKPPPPLLPPIELQRPSPPRPGTHPAQADPNHLNTATTLNGHTPIASSSSTASSVFSTPPSSPPSQSIVSASTTRTNKLNVPPTQKTLGLQQSASLGRGTTAGAISTAVQDDGNGNPRSSNGSAVPMRRNSLGDLKIPARISQAQVGLKRDLGMVREFANNIEQLKELQRTCNILISQVQQIIDARVFQHALHRDHQTSPVPTGPYSPPYATPNFFSNLKPKSRGRSNTNPVSVPPSGSQAQTVYQELVSTFHAINSRYRITWECANLLIELGGGGDSPLDSDVLSAPPTSTSAPIISQTATTVQVSITTKRSRERAITLGGDESPQSPVPSSSLPGTSVDHDTASVSYGPPLASPPSMSWRASTGRHDLSQRQLVLLQEMLHNTNAHANVSNDTDGPPPQAANVLPEELPHLSVRHTAINKDWRWGAAGNSTVTLPSEDTDQFHTGKRAMERKRKRRSGRLGMIVLRDLLRALKWNTTEVAAEESSPMPPIPNIPAHSTTSLSTESSTGSKMLRKLPPRQSSQPRRKLHTGYESVRSALGKDHKPDEQTTPPYVPSFVAAKSSPRRPSLASIFRIGSKYRPVGPPASVLPEADIHAQSSGTGEDSGNSTEEDWDRMDSASDLDAVSKPGVITDGSATVRGECHHEKRRKRLHAQRDPLEAPTSDKPMHHTILPKRSFSASQSSVPAIETPFVPSRPVRLSNVEEHETDVGNDRSQATIVRSASQSHPRCTGTKTGSVRSIPPHLTSIATSPLPVSAVAMTPENIKPLLANAREVQARLCDCIAEIQTLLEQSVSCVAVSTTISNYIPP